MRTLRHGLLDRTLIRNQRQLRHPLNEYIEHYNSRRPHRSLDQAAPDHTEPAVPVELNRRIERHSTCSGLINEYRPAAWTLSLPQQANSLRLAERATTDASSLRKRSKTTVSPSDEFSAPTR